MTQGFRGDVGVVPRQFLRQLVDIFDMVEDEDFDPMKEAGFTPKKETEDEQRIAQGKPPFDPEPEDDSGYDPAIMEF